MSVESAGILELGDSRRDGAPDERLIESAIMMVESWLGRLSRVRPAHQEERQ